MVVKSAIYRNFGGKINGAERLGQFFAYINDCVEIYMNCPELSVLDLIKNNLRDKDSRYLMLMCRQDVANFILESKFKDVIQERRTLVGSKLKNDEKKE
jgi:hypothetical protein